MGWNTDRKISSGRVLRLIYLALMLVGLYLLLKYAIGTLMPFIIAAVIALPVSSLAAACQRRLGGKRRAWCVFWLTLAWGGALLVFYFVSRQLVIETGELVELIGAHSEEIAERIKKTFDAVVALPAKLPILNKLSDGTLGTAGEKLGEAIAAMLESLLSKLSGALAGIVGRIALSTPHALIGAVVTVVSSFYICIDREKLLEFLIGGFSRESAERIERTLREILNLVRAHAKAYAYLFLVTFGELYIGLLLLGRKSAFLVALLIALIDILPLFGAGFVLLPWAVVLIANGSVASGVGMLVLLAVVSVVRQIAEPRLIGKELGIHPFISLASMYIGFAAFGFFGMLIAPVAVSCVSKITKNNRENNTQIRDEKL